MFCSKLQSLRSASQYTPAALCSPCTRSAGFCLWCWWDESTVWNQVDSDGPCWTPLHLPVHTFARTAVHGPGQVGKETILEEKQEVESVSHRLHPHPDLLHSYTSPCVLSLSTCIVLAAEVKALDILMPLFKQATTVPRACFKNTMKYIFLLFSFFQFFFVLTAAWWFVAAVLNLSQGILAVFVFFIFLRLLSFFSQTWPWPWC